MGKLTFRSVHRYHNLIRGPIDSVCVNSMVDFNVQCMASYPFLVEGLFFSTIQLRILMALVRKTMHLQKF